MPFSKTSSRQCCNAWSSRPYPNPSVSHSARYQHDIKPRQPAPSLEVKLLDGSTWRLSDAKPATFEMIVVYRGLHCPICKTYLGELESKLPEFSKRGVDVIAISTDGRNRAEKAKAEWGLNSLRVGCELSIANARMGAFYLTRDP